MAHPSFCYFEQSFETLISYNIGSTLARNLRLYADVCGCMRLHAAVCGSMRLSAGLYDRQRQNEDIFLMLLYTEENFSMSRMVISKASLIRLFVHLQGLLGFEQKVHTHWCFL